MWDRTSQSRSGGSRRRRFRLLPIVRNPPHGGYGAWLVDRVMPEVPVRQWVLSLPHRLRLLCAYDADVCARVRRVLVRAVSGNYERAARAQSKPRPRTGAVSFVQRFDSALRLNVHFHVLWLDGAYAWQPGGPVEWCEHEAVTDADVATIAKRVRTRVLRCLRRLGKWPDEQDAPPPPRRPIVPHELRSHPIAWPRFLRKLVLDSPTSTADRGGLTEVVHQAHRLCTGPRNRHGATTYSTDVRAGDHPAATRHSIPIP